MTNLIVQCLIPAGNQKARRASRSGNHSLTREAERMTTPPFFEAEESAEGNSGIAKQAGPDLTG